MKYFFYSNRLLLCGLLLALSAGHVLATLGQAPSPALLNNSEIRRQVYEMA